MGPYGILYRYLFVIVQKSFELYTLRVQFKHNYDILLQRKFIRCLIAHREDAMWWKLESIISSKLSL